MSNDPSPQSPLREAHRLLTRTRIRAAATGLFYEHGILAVTMDDIAKAAHVARSTLYAHFADKAELTADIATAYGDLLCGLVKRLPGPVPTRDQIEIWLNELAVLIELERIPATFISNVSSGRQDIEATRMIGTRLEAELAMRLPSFASALADSKSGLRARAWGEAMMRELGCACLPATDAGPDIMKARLEVAADIFEQFMRKISAIES